MKIAKKISLGSALNSGIANQAVVHSSNLNSTQAKQQNVVSNNNLDSVKPGSSIGTSGAKGLFSVGNGIASQGSSLLHGVGSIKDFIPPTAFLNDDIDENPLLPNASSVPFQVALGISQDVPTIVLSSEFLPITGTINSNDRDFALNVKEQSVLLTAKNAISFLNRDDATRALVEKHRQDNIALIKKLGNKAFILLKTLGEAEDALDIKTFAHVPRSYLSLASSGIVGNSNLFNFSGGSGGAKGLITVAGGSGPGSPAWATATTDKNFTKGVYVKFTDYLQELGWTTGDTGILSPTLTYQQFLLELKRTLLTCPRIIANKKSKSIILKQDDISAKYMLRGLFTYDDMLFQIKPLEDFDKKDPADFFIHYNIYNKLAGSGFDDMFKIKDYYRAATSYSLALSKLLSRRTTTSAPAGGAPIVGLLPDIFDISADFKLPAPGEVSLRHFVADDTIVSNLQDPKGVYAFIKEINFSRALKSQTIQQSLQQNLGYATRLTADASILTNPSLVTNTSVWDALIGSANSFRRNILDLSLASMQQLDTQTATNEERNLLGLSRSNAKVSSLPSLRLNAPIKGKLGSKFTEPDESYNRYSVLTFEKGDMPLIDDSQYGLTPGTFFYIDSSLFTVDFQKFDASRVSFLLNSLIKAKQNASLIKCIYTGRTTLSEKSVYNLLEESNKDDPYLRAVKKIDPWIMGAYRETLNVDNQSVTIDNKKKRDLLYSNAGLQWQGASITAATIFKHAIITKNMKCLRMLFHIVMRETYKKLYSDFNVEYSNFMTKMGAIQEIRKYNETEYEYNEGDVEEDEADYETITYKEPEIEGIGRMSWGNFAQWASTLVGKDGNANTPELVLDALLLNDVGMQILPHNTNISTSPPNFLLLDQCANKGKQTVIGLNDEGNEYLAGKTVVEQFEGSETDLALDIIFAVGLVLAGAASGGAAAATAGGAAAVAAGAAAVSSQGSGGLFTTKVEVSDFRVGRDVITIADNPVIKRMYHDGKSFIELLGTGLNAEQPFGLFKVIIELMFEFFKADIYKPITATPATQAYIPSSVPEPGDQIAPFGAMSGEMGCTLHAAIPKPIMLWKYFLSICQIISQMTPDNFAGFFAFSEPDTNYGGYRLAPLSSQTVNDYFSAKTTNINSVFSKRVDDFVKNYKNLHLKQANLIDILDQYINNAYKKVQNFNNQLTKDFTPYIEETKQVFDQDTTLAPEQKLALANLSYTADQLILSTYVLSELSDRIDTSNISETKLKTLPSFIDFPKGFVDYFPLNDFDAISYGAISEFFKSQEYDTFFGGNKKIISVGLPPMMMRNLMGLPSTPSRSSRSMDFKRSIVKINVYKNDILHPGIIFKPKSYYFEARRFPTRVVSNWNDISKWSGYKNTPSKYFNGREFILHKDFNEARKFIDNILDSKIVNESITSENLFYNFFQSFAAEQYIKWFSRFSIDESRYFNFNGLNSELEILTEQFNNYIASTGTPFNVQNLTVNTENAQSANAVNQALVNAEESVKRHLRNETLLMNPSSIKKRILYSKKFDRVFNIIFDPDDFEIETIDKNVVSKYIQEGLITKDNNVYEWSRQTQQSDFSFDEYWVTIEPYFTPTFNPHLIGSISKFI